MDGASGFALAGGEPDSVEAAFDQASTAIVQHRLSMAMPMTDMPGTDMPGTDMPGTDMPDADMPATDMPSQPGSPADPLGYL